MQHLFGRILGLHGNKYSKNCLCCVWCKFVCEFLRVFVAPCAKCEWLALSKFRICLGTKNWLSIFWQNDISAISVFKRPIYVKKGTKSLVFMLKAIRYTAFFISTKGFFFSLYSFLFFVERFLLKRFDVFQKPFDVFIKTFRRFSNNA